MPGQQAAFEEAFATAKTVISAAAGFPSLRLSRCLEEPNRYLLLVEWEQLEDHTIGFGGSTAYQEWQTLLHDFYDPFPTVDRYEDLTAVL
jgi:heme-degrading monooxygenase HmoA